MAFELNLNEGRKDGHERIWGKRILGKGNGTCKDPEECINLVRLKNKKTFSVARAQQM